MISDIYKIITSMQDEVGHDVNVSIVATKLEGRNIKFTFTIPHGIKPMIPWTMDYALAEHDFAYWSERTEKLMLKRIVRIVLERYEKELEDADTRRYK